MDEGEAAVSASAECVLQLCNTRKKQDKQLPHSISINIYLARQLDSLPPKPSPLQPCPLCNQRCLYCLRRELRPQAAI